MNLKMQNPKSELLSQELIILLISIKEKYIFLEVMEVLVTKDQPLMIFILMMLKLLNGTN
jgi:hypothetical protein